MNENPYQSDETSAEQSLDVMDLYDFEYKEAIRQGEMIVSASFGGVILLDIVYTIGIYLTLGTNSLGVAAMRIFLTMCLAGGVLTGAAWARWLSVVFFGLAAFVSLILLLSAHHADTGTGFIVFVFANGAAFLLVAFLLTLKSVGQYQQHQERAMRDQQDY